MAVETATNCWTQTQASIITALANSAKFREIIEAADATEAATLIFGDELVDPDDGHAYTKEELQSLKHYAQVYSADEGGYSANDDGSGWVRKSGVAIIYIERLVTEYEQNSETDPLAIERWFGNRVGDLMDQVTTYIRDNSGPQVKGWFVSAGPGTNDRKQWDSLGRWQGIEISVEWGY